MKPGTVTTEQNVSVQQTNPTREIEIERERFPRAKLMKKHSEHRGQNTGS